MTIINEEIELATGKSIEEDILKGSFEHITFNTKVSAGTMDAFSEICVREEFVSQSPYEGFLQVK